jgi:hypothetical protein
MVTGGRAYVDRRLETAFNELLHRYIDLVYSTAVRMVREQWNLRGRRRASPLI